jgi:hypothetical protein
VQEAGSMPQDTTQRAKGQEAEPMTGPATGPLSAAESEPFDDHVLLDALAFSRKVGDYLFFPVLLISSIVFGVMVYVMEHPASWLEWLLSGDAWFAIALTFVLLSSLAMWRISRRPRAGFFLVATALLTPVAAAFVGWIGYMVLVAGDWTYAVRGAAMIALTTTGAWRSFKLWRLLRRVGPDRIDRALSRLLPTGSIRR